MKKEMCKRRQKGSSGKKKKRCFFLSSNLGKSSAFSLEKAKALKKMVLLFSHFMTFFNLSCDAIFTKK